MSKKFLRCAIILGSISLLSGCNSKHSANTPPPAASANIDVSFSQQQSTNLQHGATALTQPQISFVVENTTTGATQTITESSPNSAKTVSCKIGDTVSISDDTTRFSDQSTTWTLASAATQTITVTQPNNNIDFSYTSRNTPIPPPPTGPGLVRGWPNYLAMGSITDASTAPPPPGSPNKTNGYSSFLDRPINAIFKYDGTGQLKDDLLQFPVMTVQAIAQAKDLTKQYINNKQPYSDKFTANPVIPVMVVYTANLSYPNPKLPDLKSLSIQNKFERLILLAKRLEDNKVGSIILNPDFLGTLQQNKNVASDVESNIEQADLHTLLSNAVKAVEQTCTYSTSSLDKASHRLSCPASIPNTTADNLYTSLFKNCSYGYWNASVDWNSLITQAANCAPAAKPTVPPSFPNTLDGWIQATNWIIKTFAPDISFGWQENIWASNSSAWVHSTVATDPVTIAQKDADFINSHGVYSGAYKPDYIALDRYEFDDFYDDKVCTTQELQQGCVQGNQYLKDNDYIYNARDWSRYLDFASAIGKAISKPVMLWQIPGGHMQTKNDMDKREKNGGTAPNFFFGVAVNDYSQLKPYINNLSFPATQGSVVWWQPNTSLINYLQIAPDLTGPSPYNWDSSHLQQAADNNIFAILWGGGNTTGVADLTQVMQDHLSGPGDDGGWLSQQIINYYNKPATFSPPAQ